MDAAAERTILSAARTMQGVRSYRFDVGEELVAASTQRSHLVGAVVRGQGLSYRLTIGSKTTQVVRLRSATYVRVVPQSWSRLHHPRHLVNPTQSLTRILDLMVPTNVAHVHGLVAVHGTLPVDAARHAGLPASRPAEVTVTVDRRGRVVGLAVDTTTQVSGHKVTVRLRSTYSAFGSVAPIRKPV